MRVYNQGMNTSAVVHAVVYTFGSYPQRLGPRHEARITILRDAPLDARDPLNPLGLPVTPNGNVLFNAPFYIEGRQSEAGLAAPQTSNPRLRAPLQVIANAPGSRRIWFWNQPDPRSLVSKYLQWTQHRQPGSVVQLSTYSLVHGGCGYTASRASTASATASGIPSAADRGRPRRAPSVSRPRTPGPSRHRPRREARR